MKLIDNCHCCWKLHSVQLAIVIALLGLLQGTILPLRTGVPACRTAPPHAVYSNF